MITQWTTSKEVMARIARNMRITDDTYLLDFPEWIAEAVAKMKTHRQLELVYQDLEVHMHQTKTPCEASSIASVLYNGARILPSVSDGPLINPGRTLQGTSFDNQFHSLVYDGSIDSAYGRSLNIPILMGAPCIRDVRYRVNFNKIEVGIECGTIRVYFWKVPTDEEGFPMIVDNEDYKTAIYWYVRAMMIGTGYPDKVFTYEKADAEWEKFAGRAIGQITYPTVDEVEESIINQNRILDIGTTWRNFFTSRPEGSFGI